MKIYNKKGFILGIYYLLMACSSIFFFSLDVLKIKLLVIVFILFVISCACSYTYISRSFSEKASKEDITSARAQKESTKQLEKTNSAIKFLNSAEKIATSVGIFFSTVSILLLILAFFAIKHS